MPKKLCKASKRVRKCSEPKDEENLPGRPREAPDDPGIKIARTSIAQGQEGSVILVETY